MDLKPQRMILYRGSLKSCNYRCSYCPFSKHPKSERALLKDKDQWIRFCDSLEARAGAMDIRGLMVVPYGEALIHPWYWEGLGRLGAMDTMDGVGAQTNLSFLWEPSLERYRRAGGEPGKLRLWATFHPEMTTVEEFAEKCRKLWERGVVLCAGVVGDGRNMDAITALRRELPADIYLWINKMDGLKRDYTRQERTAFEDIDPYFARELERVPADPSLCRNRLFVEGDGTMRRCNISGTLPENWYDLENDPKGETLFAGGKETVSCKRKACSCYLAYGGRDEAANRVLFGPYGLFRIPLRPKAAFLDIDKTLIPEGESRLAERTVTDLTALRKDGCRLFFATSRPYGHAARACKKAWHLFDGGVFAGGAHLVFRKEGEKQEYFFPLEPEWIAGLESQREKYGFRILTYRHEGHGITYKATLVRPRHKEWTEEETEALSRSVKGQESRVRCFAEGSCLQIVHEKASKAEGVRMICQSLGILPGDTVAVGDGPEDQEMMELCNRSGVM